MNETPVEMYWVAPLIQWGLFFLVAAVGFRATKAGRAAFWLLVVFVAMNFAAFAEQAAPRWDQVTRHSDTPDQVVQGIHALRGEATGRINSLRRIRFRAQAKAEEASKIGDEFHLRLGEAWMKTWEEASTAIGTLQAEALSNERPAP